MNTTQLRITAGASLLALGLVAVGTATAGSASAKGGGDVRASGACSAASDWKLKAKPDNGRIEVEFEVDSNKVGQTWAVKITDQGVTVLSGNRVTVAPSGSFTARVLTANRAGADTFVATARNAATGETCRGSLSIR